MRSPITFALGVPGEDSTRRATEIAPRFTAWLGLPAKWWLGDAASGTSGGVYLFASQRDADRSRETDLLRGMFADPARTNITIREYDGLESLTAITAVTSQAISPARQAQ